MADAPPPAEPGPTERTDDPGPAPAAGTDEPSRPPPSPRWSSPTKHIVAVAMVVVGLVLLYISRNVIALAALAGLIAFLVAPVIRVLHERLRVPRPLALLVSYVGVFVSLLLVGFLVADGVVGAVRDIDIAEAEKSLESTARDWLGNVREIRAFGFTVDLSETVDPLLENLRETDESRAAASSAESRRLSLSSKQVETLFGGISTSVRSLGSAVVAALMSGVITLLVALYLNADSTKFRTALMGAVPGGYEGDAEQLAGRTLHIWRGYLYGQMFNSLTIGLMMWLALWLVGLPGAFVFALILALLNMVPTFGPILAAIPSVLAAFALGSTRLDMSRVGFTLLVAVLYIGLVQLHSNLMAPFITGRAVRLSPATVMLGLLVGIHVGGIVGALLVVPVLACGKEYGRYVLAKLTDRDPFESPDGAVAATADGA